MLWDVLDMEDVGAVDFDAAGWILKTLVQRDVCLVRRGSDITPEGDPVDAPFLDQFAQYRVLSEIVTVFHLPSLLFHRSCGRSMPNR
jgi:hypothetical protein